MRSTKQGGFTLIELIVVMVILGILAAFAIPKSISLESSARTASINALAGAIRSANALAHALAVVESKATQASGETVTMEGTSVALAFGYPIVGIGPPAGITAALNMSADYSYTAGTFTIDGYTPSSGNCEVVYAAATGVSAPSSITVDEGGC